LTNAANQFMSPSPAGSGFSTKTTLERKKKYKKLVQTGKKGP